MLPNNEMRLKFRLLFNSFVTVSEESLGYKTFKIDRQEWITVKHVSIYIQWFRGTWLNMILECLHFFYLNDSKVAVRIPVAWYLHISVEYIKPEAWEGLLVNSSQLHQQQKHQEVKCCNIIFSKLLKTGNFKRSHQENNICTR